MAPERGRWTFPRAASGERLGLLMIASALAAITVTSAVFLEAQLRARRDQSRTQGVALVRLLSQMPYARLVPRDGSLGPLGVVQGSQANPDFAYGVVEGPAGEPLASIGAPGLLVPPASMPSAPAAWTGERRVRDGEGRDIVELFAPVLEGGQRVAQVRVGFVDPGLGIVMAHARPIGLLALPIFLLAPLAHLLLRREVRPVAAARDQLERLSQGQDFHPIEAVPGGEVRSFVQSFNRFVELAETRVKDLESQQTSAVASSRVLSYQKNRIESVLETLPDAAIVLDETGAVTFANSKLESLLGVAAESALGHKPADWCPQSEVVAFLASYQGPNPRLCRSDSIELELPGASPRRVAVSAHPIVPARGAAPVPGTLVLMRDVTAEAVARQAQGEFISHVAHELKSPLNVMAMYSEALLGAEGESEQFRIEACNVLQDEVERVSMLVTTLLSIARIESGAVVLERQRVRLQDLLGDALESLSRAARKADLTFELKAGELAPIWVDKDLLRVAINNLLTNAIKYNQPGGRVELGAEDLGEQIAIRVRDTGIGIAEQDLERVFEKFFRSESKEAQQRGGHGLGLSLAREIVELHGGEIAVETAPDEGSVFSILLRKTPALTKESTG